MAYEIPAALKKRLKDSLNHEGQIVVLTGAGISAESGIPTFRGREGYWTLGAKEYHPQEMATNAMFRVNPAAVWAWYLYRRNVCNAASPNAGHLALARMEELLGDRFQLITQNVDGLHLRAGNTLQRTYQIHGNVNYARCSKTCTAGTWPLSNELNGTPQKKEKLSESETGLLHCPHCNQWARPHILWFDEYYNEEYYKYESSIRKAIAADILLVIGTSGATNLPMQIGYQASQTSALIIDVNIESNPFSQLAEQKNGFFLQGTGAAILPVLLNIMQ